MADFLGITWAPPVQKPKTTNLYYYSGLRGEKVPKDVTHVIVKANVKTIRKEAFHNCRFLVYVKMGDSVKRIEKSAFSHCYMLKVVILSKTLEYIGEFAFNTCRVLEGLILPSTVNEIVCWAFDRCCAMRLLILPSDIDVDVDVDGGVGVEIITGTAISKIAEAAGIRYEPPAAIENGVEPEEMLELDQEEDPGEEWVPNELVGHVPEQGATHESVFHFNNWLIHHMDGSQLHKICYDVFVTATKINNYLDAGHGHGKDDSALHTVDSIHGMLPLHMLTRNPHAPADAILALLKANTNAVNAMDYENKTPFTTLRLTILVHL